MARSAEAVTAVVTDEVLSAGFGSAVVDATDAVLVRDAAWFGAVTVTAMAGADVPVARSGRVHVTETLPAFEQTHPVPVADTKVTPAGRVSVTATLAASDGPAFATVSVYPTVPAATTVAGPVFAIDRSARAVTPVDAVAVLLPAFGSAVAADTTAVSVSEAAWAGAVTVTVIVGAVAPVASEALVHVTDTLPLLTHDQPVPVALTKVMPAGSVSVTDTAVASEGPLSTTTSE